MIAMKRSSSTTTERDAQREQLVRTVVAVVLVILVVGTSLATYRKVAQGRSAFVRWQPQILEMFHGEDIYTKRSPANVLTIMTDLPNPLTSDPPMPTPSSANQ